jgi:branched-subunit amino acid transport protein
MTGTDALLLVAMAACVYAPKALPLVFLPERLPAAVRSWLGYVTPAVLSALVAAEIAAPKGELTPPRLEHLSYLAVALVALFSRRVWLSLVVGLAVLLLVRQLRG